MKTTRILHMILLCSLFATLSGGKQAAQAAAWQSKVDPLVLQTAAQGETEFLVLLAQQADLSAANRITDKKSRGQYVYEQLTRRAAETQAGLIAQLEAQGADYRAYWIANMLWVRGDQQVVQALAQRPEVSRLYANPRVRLQEPQGMSQPLGPSPAAPGGVEWNIAKINAPAVWAQGYNGQGAVIGGQDTGYDWQHPALKAQYRGWDGASANHNYNWHDAIHTNDPHTGAGNPCGFDSLEPCDDYGHGTHTMGTMVGDDGAGNQVGVAPGARWIGCRNMEQGWGTPAAYSECYQWFVAPTDLNNLNPRPDLAPEVINNSWSCPQAEGCSQPDILLQVVQNVRAAGILTAHSAGNNGESCSTISEPAATYDASFTVGNTDNKDHIAGSSSRGPVTVDGSNRLKPDVSAPGTQVRSSIRGGLYASLSGTSMAAPHVAGLTALLLSAHPELRGQVDVLEDIIRRSAVPLTSTQNCGDIPGTHIPNNTFGWGRIDAWAAFQALSRDPYLSIEKSAPIAIESGAALTYTLSVAYTAILTASVNVILSDTLPANTLFITATQPYTLAGSLVTWALPGLAPGEVRSVELVVSPPLTATGWITNAVYSASGPGLPTISGPPVGTVILGPIKLYFPWFPIMQK